MTPDRDVGDVGVVLGILTDSRLRDGGVAHVVDRPGGADGAVVTVVAGIGVGGRVDVGQGLAVDL